MLKNNQGMNRVFKSLVIAAGLLSFSAAYADDIAEGKKVAENRKKGNCLRCHYIEGGAVPGNIGPPLVAMKARFPNKSDLRSQIYDATLKNPYSIMPPFGKHGALSDKEVDLITEYVYSL